MTERYKTLGQTTLNGAINNSVTSVVVTSATSVCGATFTNSTDTCRLRIDNEIIIVTSISTNTLTVTRAAEGTAAASHSDGATVTQVVTASALDQIKVDGNIPGVSNGSTKLTSSFTGSGATNVWQDTGLQVSLPAAGVYLVIGKALLSYLRLDGTSYQINVRLHDGTNPIVLGAGYAVGTTQLDEIPMPALYTAAGATTVKMQLMRTFDGATLNNTGIVVGDATLVYSNITWIRLS